MRVWLYYRLSRDEDDELNSLKNQRSIIESYALSNGHTIVGESFDDNVSGMHFNRAGIEKIYEAVESGVMDAIVVKDLSRLGLWAVRLLFTTENTREVDRVLDDYLNPTPFDPGACTRGLYLRGVE